MYVYIKLSLINCAFFGQNPNQSVYLRQNSTKNNQYVNIFCQYFLRQIIIERIRGDEMLFCQKVNNSDDIKNVFREWCELYYTSVLKYCTCILEHKEDAEDCVQEVFKNVMKHCSQE